MDPLSQIGFAKLFSFFVPKLLTAIVCGGIVGWERAKKHKVAGIKTNILICAGVTMFTALAFLLGGADHDPLRVIAQIISGVGFLGAGSIFKSNSKVFGLTTAAFIWYMSAIGVIIGSGGYLVAVCLTAGMVVFTLVLERLERRFMFNKKRR
jgi:putative Mg2+ transporter-C (MgtC) family protein